MSAQLTQETVQLTQETAQLTQETIRHGDWDVPIFWHNLFERAATTLKFVAELGSDQTKHQILKSFNDEITNLSKDVDDAMHWDMARDLDREYFGLRSPGFWWRPYSCPSVGQIESGGEKLYVVEFGLLTMSIGPNLPAELYDLCEQAAKVVDAAGAKAPMHTKLIPFHEQVQMIVEPLISEHKMRDCDAEWLDNHFFGISMFDVGSEDSSRNHFNCIQRLNHLHNFPAVGTKMAIPQPHTNRTSTVIFTGLVTFIASNLEEDQN